jgi:hypothetical protein
MGQMFTNIHDQEIEISERFFDVICAQMPRITLRSAAPWERQQQIAVLKLLPGNSSHRSDAMPLIIIGICSLVSFIGAAAITSALQPQESDDIRLERKIAKSSKKWCPPNHNQRTVNDYPQS